MRSTPARRSVATRTRASAARTGRRVSSSTPKPRACCCRSAINRNSSRAPRRLPGCDHSLVDEDDLEKRIADLEGRAAEPAGDAVDPGEESVIRRAVKAYWMPVTIAVPTLVVGGPALLDCAVRRGCRLLRGAV